VDASGGCSRVLRRLLAARTTCRYVWPSGQRRRYFQAAGAHPLPDADGVREQAWLPKMENRWRARRVSSADRLGLCPSLIADLMVGMPLLRCASVDRVPQIIMRW